MYTNILVALSSTQIAQSEHHIFEMDQAERESFEISRNVFDEAIALAKSSEATLTLLHVVSEQELQEGIAECGNQENFEQECHRRLKLLEEEALAKGINEVNIPDRSAFKFSLATPGEIICDYARRWKNDLIIVGRRERGFHLLGPGRVSAYVIRHAPCTTLIVNTLTSISPEDTISSEDAANSEKAIASDNTSPVIVIHEVIEVER